MVAEVRKLSEMTVDELNALPEFCDFTYVSVGVEGGFIRRPVANHRQAYFIDKDTPLAWTDASGCWWQPVLTQYNVWMKERAR